MLSHIIRLSEQITLLENAIKPSTAIYYSRRIYWSAYMYLPRPSLINSLPVRVSSDPRWSTLDQSSDLENLGMIFPLSDIQIWFDSSGFSVDKLCWVGFLSSCVDEIYARSHVTIPIARKMNTKSRQSQPPNPWWTSKVCSIGMNCFSLSWDEMLRSTSSAPSRG